MDDEKWIKEAADALRHSDSILSDMKLHLSFEGLISHPLILEAIHKRESSIAAELMKGNFEAIQLVLITGDLSHSEQIQKAIGIGISKCYGPGAIMKKVVPVWWTTPFLCNKYLISGLVEVLEKPVRHLEIVVSKKGGLGVRAEIASIIDSEEDKNIDRFIRRLADRVIKKLELIYVIQNVPEFKRHKRLKIPIESFLGKVPFIIEAVTDMYYLQELLEALPEIPSILNSTEILNAISRAILKFEHPWIILKNPLLGTILTDNVDVQNHFESCMRKYVNVDEKSSWNVGLLADYVILCESAAFKTILLELIESYPERLQSLTDMVGHRQSLTQDSQICSTLASAILSSKNPWVSIEIMGYNPQLASKPEMRELIQNELESWWGKSHEQRIRHSPKTVQAIAYALPDELYRLLNYEVEHSDHSRILESLKSISRIKTVNRDIRFWEYFRNVLELSPEPWKVISSLSTTISIPEDSGVMDTVERRYPDIISAIQDRSCGPVIMAHLPNLAMHSGFGEAVSQSIIHADNPKQLLQHIMSLGNPKVFADEHVQDAIRLLIPVVEDRKNPIHCLSSSSANNVTIAGSNVHSVQTLLKSSIIQSAIAEYIASRLSVSHILKIVSQIHDLELVLQNEDVIIALESKVPEIISLIESENESRKALDLVQYIKKIPMLVENETLRNSLQTWVPYHKMEVRDSANGFVTRTRVFWSFSWESYVSRHERLKRHEALKEEFRSKRKLEDM